VKTRLIAVGLGALTLVAGGGAWWLRAGASAVTVDEIGDRVQTVRRGELSVFAERAEVAALYRFAAEHPEALADVLCTCGCVSFGHASNRFCCIKTEAADRVTFTSHRRHLRRLHGHHA